MEQIGQRYVHRPQPNPSFERAEDR